MNIQDLSKRTGKSCTTRKDRTRDCVRHNGKCNELAHGHFPEGPVLQGCGEGALRGFLRWTVGFKPFPNYPTRLSQF